MCRRPRLSGPGRKAVYMKLRHFFAGFFLCIAAVLVFSSGTALAKVSKKITLKPETTLETHNTLKIDITVDAKNVKSIEMLGKKVTKTADKFWKDAIPVLGFYFDKELKKTVASEWVNTAATYSFRVTTNSGKKYVNYIKISNLAPVDEEALLEASIKKVSKPDKNGNYTITVDFFRQIALEASEFEGRKVGDTFDIDGRTVTIVSMKTLDKNNEEVELKQYDEIVQCIVVRPKKVTDFWDTKKDTWVLDSPENADFGFIRDFSGDVFEAFIDYDYWNGGDYYVEMNDIAIKGAKFKVTDKTTARLAYVDYQKESLSRYITGTKYLAIREGKESIEGVYVYKEVGVYIYRKYNKKTGKFTNTVSEIVEIYTP